MPGLDRSGPIGGGPMTGGQRGLCGRSGSVAGLPAYGGVGYGRRLGFRRGAGREFGPGRGRGRGSGRDSYGYPPAYPIDAPMDTAEEMNMLKAEADYMKKSMEAINKRIEELEKEPLP